MSETKQRYINVVLNVPLNQAFTYREPPESDRQPLPKNPFGYRVEVKFGNRKTTGFVTGVYDQLPKDCAVGEEKIRSALRYIDSENLLTEELYSLATFMSAYYIAPIGECVFAMIPSGKRETEIPGFSFFQDEKGFEKKELSNEQKTAVDGILAEKNRNHFHYLYGTTGSGKTEVFLTCPNWLRG